jgi:hypothetical protein
MLLLLRSGIDYLDYLLYGVFNRVRWIPHVMDDHVQEYLRIYKLLF